MRLVGAGRTPRTEDNGTDITLTETNKDKRALKNGKVDPYSVHQDHLHVYESAEVRVLMLPPRDSWLPLSFCLRINLIVSALQ